MVRSARGAVDRVESGGEWKFGAWGLRAVLLYDFDPTLVQSSDGVQWSP